MTFHVGDSEPLPPDFYSYDRESLTSQHRAAALNLVRLLGVAVGATFGVLGAEHRESPDPSMRILFVVSAVGFVFALLADFLILTRGPEKKWYQAREAAESIKSLAWCYSVCGAPFERTRLGAQELFIERYATVISEMNDGVLVGTRLEKVNLNNIIVDPMDDLRNSPLVERREAYIRGRTRKQVEWYSGKARHNERLSLFWKCFLIVAEIVAIGLITPQIFGIKMLDWAGIMAALIAAGAAWTHFKQHTALASAYGRARDDLVAQVGMLSQIDSEEEWATAVAAAEEAISREHRLWQATLPSVASP